MDSVRRGEAWLEISDEAEQFTAVIANLRRECREWAPGAANAEAIIDEVSGVIKRCDCFHRRVSET